MLHNKWSSVQLKLLTSLKTPATEFTLSNQSSAEESDILQMNRCASASLCHQLSRCLNRYTMGSLLGELGCCFDEIFISKMNCLSVFVWTQGFVGVLLSICNIYFIKYWVASWMAVAWNRYLVGRRSVLSLACSRSDRLCRPAAWLIVFCHCNLLQHTAGASRDSLPILPCVSL